MLYIRGAVTANNTFEEISSQSVKLISEIFVANGIVPQNVSAMLFTVTKDIRAANPCTAVRKHFGMDNVAFMCMQEADINGAANACIRVLVVAEGQGKPAFVYLDGAKKLRK